MPIKRRINDGMQRGKVDLNNDEYSHRLAFSLTDSLIEHGQTPDDEEEEEESGGFVRWLENKVRGELW
ncbi:hypothetical protein [Thalassotalea sp. Y01]|uniref:hypothetical protein n=1 Tax=Thalassotalea sp. Y01 TaxID=2729613 RepID=UPI00145E7359|nr:hypothetical protein [Thalassotalea sp. Y01]NMP16132.1 hypothetical protein [Thalassotalea sp. Y01]